MGNNGHKCIHIARRWWAELLCRPVFSHFRTFRITCHTHGHIIKLTVLLLSSRGHFIIRPMSFHYPAEVILLFSTSTFNFNFAFLLLLCFLSHSCSRHSRGHSRCHGEAIVTFAELCEILPFSLFRVAFFFFLFYYFWLFVNFAFTFS